MHGIVRPGAPDDGLGSRADSLVAVMALSGLTLLFYALWWNRYLGLTLEGWFLYYGREIFAGAVPYRDFYLFAPPLHALVVGALDKVFSGNLAAIRAFGGVERLIAGIITFFWLRRLFGARAAFVVIVPAVFCVSADISDILFYYQQDAAFLVVVGAFALCVAVEGEGVRGALLGLVAGLAFGLALVTRQTVGLLVALTAFCLLAWLAASGALRFRRAAGLAVAVLAGGVLAVAPILLWLSSRHALGAFVDQVFIDGPASKGTLVAILLRPFTGLLTASSRIALAAAVVLLLGMIGLWRLPRRGDVPAPVFAPALVGGAMLLAMLVGGLLALVPAPLFARYDTLLRMVRLSGVEFGFIGSLVIFAWLALRGIFRRPVAGQAGLLVAFGLTAAATYAAALSGAAYEPMIFPAFPLTAGLILAAPARAWDGRAPRLASLKGAVILSLGLAIVAVVTASKLRAPYDFAGFAQGPVWTPRGETTLAPLKGLALPQRTAADIGAIVAWVDRESSPTDPIVATPSIPLIYVLAHRRAATFAPVAFIDVAPDKVVRADAARLLAHPPKVIVAQDQTDAVLTNEEREFRAGARSGQRDLSATLARLRPLYDVVYVARFEGPPTLPIEVWARRR